MQVFYSDQLSPAMVLPARIKLNDEESHHAIKSMRLKNGDSLILTDGKGYHYKAMMAASAIPNAFVIVNEVRQVKDFDKPHLHLAISLLKNPDRLEWMLEKAVELEIDEISFIICERTEKPSVNMERMKRIAIAALKQSMGACLPNIYGPLLFDEFLENYNPRWRGFIAWCEERNNILWEVCPQNTDIVVIIGPEGDFSNREVNKAISKGFVPVNLGRKRLRAETAGLTSIMWFHLFNKIY